MDRRKNTESKSSRKVAKTNKEKLKLLSKCTMCDRKRLRFIKNQEASGLLCNLGLKTPLNKIPVLCDIIVLKYKDIK